MTEQTSPSPTPSNPTSSPQQQPASAGQPVLRVDDLRVTFQGSSGAPAVDGISFTVSHGEVLALVGESGSGKTITARSVLGLLPGTATATGDIRLAVPATLADERRTDRESVSEVSASNGSVRLTGNLLGADVDWPRIRGRGAAMIFQEPQTALNPVRTIGWQLIEALRAHRRIGRSAARARAAALLIMVDLTETDRILRSYPYQLSGGQKQRIVIALALAGEPALLIADEPTTALDVTVQEEILTLLAGLRDRLGTAILLITHNMGVVADLADHVLVLRRGQLVERGEVIALFDSPQADYTRQLLAAVPRLPDPAEVAAPEMSAAPGEESSSHEPAVRFVDVEVSFPARRGRAAFRALSGVSVDLARGSVLGVVGESGSGKSTLARTASGTQPTTGGRVYVDGVEIGSASPSQLRRIRRGIGFVQQDPATTLDPRFTVADCIAEPFRVHRVASGSVLRRRVDALLDQVRLPAHFCSRLPGELSGGQRQRVALARALALRPQLLIADEPTSALDVSVQAEVLELFAELQAEHGFACLFISHDLAVVDQVSDRILVLKSGRVIETGPTTAVLTAPTTDYTRALLEAAPVPDPEAQRLRHARADREPAAVG